MIVVYPLLGLLVLVGLFFMLSRVTLRQRHLDAELTRLERLAAEVTMSAEAVLDRVDERAELLHQLIASADAKQPDAKSAAPGEPAQPEPQPAQAAAIPEPAPAPTSLQRYQQMRTAVWALAEQGHTQVMIARSLGLPTGEVQLMLNLRGRKRA